MVRSRSAGSEMADLGRMVLRPHGSASLLVVLSRLVGFCPFALPRDQCRKSDGRRNRQNTDGPSLDGVAPREGASSGDPESWV